jgi:translation initiation factor 1
MSKKKLNSFSGLVYSTDPNFKLGEEEVVETETLLPGQQKLYVRLDTKHRAGKVVTLIEGFVGKESDLEDIGKKIKTHCGTGGSAKDGEIIVQGDNRDKVMLWLNKNGFTSVKRK